MRRKVVAALVVGAVAAGAYLVDGMRVHEAEATLQNRVRLAASEARDTLEHSAALTLHLTCGAGDEVQVRSVDVELQASQLTKANLMSHVPSGCKLSNVQLNAVHLVGSESREVALESPQFRNGTAQVTVAQSASGVEITATGTANAGWFGRKIEATFRQVVDDAEQRKGLIEKVAAALSGTGAQVAVTQSTETETKGESQQAAKEPESNEENRSTAAEFKSGTTASTTSSSSSSARTSSVTVPATSSSQSSRSPESAPSAVQQEPEPEPEPEPAPAEQPEETAATGSETTQWQGTTEDLLREVCSGDSSRSWPAVAGIDLLCSNMSGDGNQ